MVLPRKDTIYMVPRPLQKLGGEFDIFRCVHTYTLCSSNSKGQIKDVKFERMTLNLWRTLRQWEEKKRSSHI